MTETQLAPVIARRSLSNTYRYAGGIVSILIDGEDTGGTFSAWEASQKPGGEPPLHLHHTMDETFYIVEGNIRFMVGDRIIDGGPGDMVFAPRGIPHTFRIKSEVAKAVTVCTPAGFEEWFRELGEPVQSLELPGEIKPLSEADFAKTPALAMRLRLDLIQRDVNF